MTNSAFRLDYASCLAELRERVRETAPGRIQLLVGPRQVGKTTLLLELAGELGPAARYAAMDGPEAALPGFWERIWAEADAAVAARGRAVVLLDEVHLLRDWAARLKSQWDRIRRRRAPIAVVATGSSSLRIGAGSKESLAGRFERLTLAHWTARAASGATSCSRVRTKRPCRAESGGDQTGEGGSDHNSANSRSISPNGSTRTIASPPWAASRVQRPPSSPKTSSVCASGSINQAWATRSRA